MGAARTAERRPALRTACELMVRMFIILGFMRRIG